MIGPIATRVSGLIAIEKRRVAPGNTLRGHSYDNPFTWLCRKPVLLDDESTPSVIRERLHDVHVVVGGVLPDHDELVFGLILLIFWRHADALRSTGWGSDNGDAGEISMFSPTQVRSRPPGDVGREVY